MDNDQYYSAFDELIYSIKDKVLKTGSIYKNAFKIASNLNYSHPGLSSEVYFNHPLRVAIQILKYIAEVDDEILAVALLHNIVEVCPDSYKKSLDVLPYSIQNAIEVLTVDRAKQHNKTYKKNYYSRIEKDSIVASKVKVFDKMDNLYMICFNPDNQIRKIYIDEIEEFVIPLAKKYTNSEVVSCLQLSVDEAKSIGYLDKEFELKKARHAKDRNLLPKERINFWGK